MCYCISLPLFSSRCCSSRHLQSSREEHGPFRSSGVGSWTDCTDINHLLFEDPCYTLRFLWKCHTSHKETCTDSQNASLTCGSEIIQECGSCKMRFEDMRQDCPLVFKWLHYRTAPYVPPSQARRIRLCEATSKRAPCLAVNQINIDAEWSFLTVLC